MAMPIFEYQCTQCGKTFERLQPASSPPPPCPACGQPTRKELSAPRVGASRAGFDDRARSAGFHKLQRVSKGEYEKKY